MVIGSMGDKESSKKVFQQFFRRRFNRSWQTSKTMRKKR